MVQFNEKSFTIEVETGGSPIEHWLETHDHLLDLLQSEHPDMHENRYRIYELLREMMPDYQTARKMVEKK